MSWSKDDSGRPRRGYHHGNLKEALVEAARTLIAEKGASGFTFAEAARLAGVSAAAPYRHFRDRDALMADVARRGFELFAESLSDAWADGRPAPLAAFERVGLAYLRFARREPAYFAAMFEAGLSVDADPELVVASNHAFEVLRGACAVVAGTLPERERPPVLMMALHIWSLSHGIAALFARGDAARRKSPISPEELLESAILIYFRGLGIEPGAAGQ